MNHEELKREFKYKRMKTIHDINMLLLKENMAMRDAIKDLLPLVESYEMCFSKKSTPQKKRIQAIIDKAKNSLSR